MEQQFFPDRLLYINTVFYASVVHTKNQSDWIRFFRVAAACGSLSLAAGIEYGPAAGRHYMARRRLSLVSSLF